MSRRALPPWKRAPSTNRNNDYRNTRETLTPRLRHALLGYAVGTFKTKKEAAEAVGAHPVSVSLASRSPAGIELMESAYQIMQDRTLSATALIAKLSRRSVEIVATMAEDSPSESLRLKAAQDLLDRNPATSKTTKIQADMFTLSGKDAQSIASAMVQAAAMTDKFKEAAEGDFIRVDTSQASDLSMLPPIGDGDDTQRENGLSDDSVR